MMGIKVGCEVEIIMYGRLERGLVVKKDDDVICVRLNGRPVKQFYTSEVRLISRNTMRRTAAKIIAFADWLGQQDETLVECYEKRLKLWGLV